VITTRAIAEHLQLSVSTVGRALADDRRVLYELHRTDVKVPRDLSVVGFGDEPGFCWRGPGLTTTILPIQEIAAAGAVAHAPVEREHR
jgi:DNA-binding LacI/PurR family transcriptional regulator